MGKLKFVEQIHRSHFVAIAVTLVALLFVPLTADASDFGSENLQDGMEHEHVEKLQELLVEAEYLSADNASGVFDSTTQDAVSSYQESKGLLVDGIAGPQTLSALYSLEKGDENTLVEHLQSDLQAFGYFGSTVDGVFGSLTEEAVKGFQTDAGLSADGVAGPKTFSAMMTFSPTATTEQETATSEEPEQETASASTEEATATESQSSNASSSPEGTTIQMEATAYTAYCDGCSGITATGIDLRNDPHANVVAVDPNVIPLGSRVYVEGYGEAIAGDTGGAINGNKIDLHVPTREEALNFGRQTVSVTILN
ncbi:peptidoglycan-binding protein [Geomicrobium sp. JCM 19038]|uniref:peptidoglycan-binding protein n=1 Tax=Geomicrobium sp. JCM 19038 TaxID=1460635 RepID=UPI00045F2187|nr:peptidoglycan-binding protein [Geomicrobium sp. JCM 19038]GAK10053.1 cell wall-binding protein [Geomicrobium sp. JCM 19038]